MASSSDSSDSSKSIGFSSILVKAAAVLYVAIATNPSSMKLSVILGKTRV